MLTVYRSTFPVRAAGVCATAIGCPYLITVRRQVLSSASSLPGTQRWRYWDRRGVPIVTAGGRANADIHPHDVFLFSFIVPCDPISSSVTLYTTYDCLSRLAEPNHRRCRLPRLLPALLELINAGPTPPHTRLHLLESGKPVQVTAINQV